MKRLPFLLLALLTITTCTTQDSLTAPDLKPSFQIGENAPCESVTLSTQADVDAFGCVEVTGGLTIQGDDITDLGPLSILTSVGNLYIWDNDLLGNLDGLSALTSVAYLSIYDNDLLQDLDGLSGLSSVENGVEVSYNRALTNVDGLSKVTSTFWVNVIGNESLTTLGGLSGLTEVAGLFVNHNDALANLDGLSALTLVGFYLSVVGNDALSNINGLSGLTTAGAVVIEDNPALTDLDGLSALTRATAVWIESNEGLTNVDGLSRLQSVLSRLWVKENPELSECATGLYATLVGGGFLFPPEIADNARGCNSPEEILVIGLTRIVDQLASDGVLNDGQASSLLVRLRVLQGALEADRRNVVDIIGALAKQIEAWVGGGVMPIEKAQPLIDGLSAITWYI